MSDVCQRVRSQFDHLNSIEHACVLRGFFYAMQKIPVVH